MNEHLVLQYSVFPDANLNKPASLYFHAEDLELLSYTSKLLCVPKNLNVSFDSFFNSFDLHKWFNFTHVKTVGLDIDVEGKGNLLIYVNCDGKSQLIKTVKNTSSLKLNDILVGEFKSKRNCRVYVCWESITDCVIKNIKFITNDSTLNSQGLALVITTYNRQQAILKTVERFQKIYDDDDFWQQHVHLYIIDNGSNLPLTSSHNISYYRNRNWGGAGGFSRGLYEAKLRGKETYCIFMDDDASCESESIRRAYVFMCLSTSAQQMVAGSMLYEDNPTIVYESGALYPYKKIMMFPLKHNVDVSTHQGITEFNNDTGHATYAAWWFCGFKISAIKYYAFPFFVRGDDILFGLMHHFKIVSLNGVASWQINFNQKYSALVEYLSVRGLLVPAFIYPSFSKRVIISFWLFVKVLLLCFSYRYSSAESILEAYKDVMSGPDFWISDPDAQKVRAKIGKLALDEQPGFYANASEIRQLNFSRQESFFSKAGRLILLNGHLIPIVFFANKVVRISNSHIHPTRHVFFFSRVIYQTEQMQFISLGQNKKRFFKIMAKTFYLVFTGFFKYNNISKEYKSKIDYLTSLKFWGKYFP